MTSSVCLLLLCGVLGTHSYNIESEANKTFTMNGEERFGQKVIQFQNSEGTWLVVSSPGLEGSGNNGKIHKCQMDKEFCEEIYIETEGSESNLSLLTMEAFNSTLMACSSTMAESCLSNKQLTGTCYSFNDAFQTIGTMRPGYKECHFVTTDTVILFDGSNSLDKRDFINSKAFVEKMMKESGNDLMQFAVVQFSADVKLEIDFTTYRNSKTNLASLMNNITQMEKITDTATAIKFVVNKVFTNEAGAREEAKKLLIVITDGESTDTGLDEAIMMAEEKKIVRWVIAVGNNFQERGRKEMKAIASQPDNLYYINDYSELNNVLQSFKEKMYLIEGTQESKSASFAMEMSQGGFSALISKDTMVFGTVGAYDWSGGLMEYVDGKQIFINVSQAHTDMKNSYLGYSVTGANVGNKSLYIVGAPRYLHKGKVVIFSKDASNGSWAPIQHIIGHQIGEYFGCELCSVDLTQDGVTDLLLIGAPLYHDHDFGGMVSVCVLRNLENSTCTDTLYGKEGNVFSRFGSAISELQDVNGDGINDVAIGAPLEDEHAGCLYIFNGERNSINPVYSQRISGLSRPGLKYLGQSIHGILDMTGDGLIDLAVGALQTALIFRSRPVINVTTNVTFSLRKIPRENFLCSERSENFQSPVTNATICFHVLWLSPDKLGEISTHLTYRLDLDSEKQQRRVTFSASQKYLTGNLSISHQSNCMEQQLFIPNCIEDYFSPLWLNVSFTLLETPPRMGVELQPILSPQCDKNLSVLLPLQKNCGADEVCEDMLNVSINNGRVKEVVLGKDSLLNATIELQNFNEDSYNAVVTILYPAFLMFNKITKLPMYSERVQCRTEETHRLLCDINHPVLQGNTSVQFIVEFVILIQDEFRNNTIEIHATTSSDNNSTKKSHTKMRATIKVLKGINIILYRFESTRNIRITKHERVKHHVTHIYKLESRGQHSSPVNVTFTVPLNIQPGLSFDLSQPIQSNNSKEQICFKENHKDLTSDSPWTCVVDSLEKNKPVVFTIEGDIYLTESYKEIFNNSVMWSKGNIFFNLDQYIELSIPTSHSAEIFTEIEIFEEYNLMPVIIWSSFGAFVLLLIMIGAFYKCGFFKRSLRDQSNENEGTKLTEIQPVNSTSEHAPT